MTGNIRNYLQQGAPIGDDVWAIIEREVTTRFPLFKSQLYRIAKPSEIQYRVYLLIKCGVTPTEIAVSMARTKSAISNMRRRLYLRVFPNGSNKYQNWDEYICDL